MPSLSWIALASVLSAAIGAAIARAVGRAFQASGRRPRRPHPSAMQVGIGSARPPAAAHFPDASPRPEAATATREVNVRVVADADQPIALTVQRVTSDGADSGRHRILLPGPATPEGAPAIGRQSPGEVPVPPGRRLGIRRAWAAAVGEWQIWRTVRRASPELILALAAAAFYLVSRLWAIDSFPLYFYSDEVNYVLFGERAVQRGLVGQDGSWPAVYVEWDTNRWGPAIGIYPQAVAALLLGRHIAVARGTEALISLGGVLAVAWILKDHFRSRFWWASILLAAGVPAWFLYTRTGFSVAAGASFFAIFLLAYLRYRFRSPSYLPLAAVAGALAFYAYSNMMLLMSAAAVCLLASDFRYHLQQRRAWLRTLPVLVLLAVPFLEFRLLHPESIRANLSALASYWIEDIPLTAKLVRYLQNYLQGLSPFYWFGPEKGTGILPVQYIPGAGHLGFTLLPLVGIGVYVVLRNLRSPQHRLILLSALVVPLGAALDTIEIYRVLSMVIPALLLAGLGLDQLGAWLKSVPPRVQASTVVVVLFVLALARLIGALVYGPTWPTDYGLGGAQFGAKAVYVDTIPDLLAEDPETVVIMNTTWANNAHIYPSFFLSAPEQERVRFGNVREYLENILPLDPETVVAMLPDEYADAIASPMLGKVDVVRTVYRPNGEPGFYFARIAYAPDAQRVMQELLALRYAPVEEQVNILGQLTTVVHSKLGDGQIANLFDGSAETLVRGDRVNPLKIEIRFPQPIALHGLRVTVGSIQDFTLDLRLTSPDSGVPLAVSERFRNLGADPTVSLTLPAAEISVSIVSLEITDHTQGAEAMIHVREITFR